MTLLYQHYVQYLVKVMHRKTQDARCPLVSCPLRTKAGHKAARPRGDPCENIQNSGVFSTGLGRLGSVRSGFSLMKLGVKRADLMKCRANMFKSSEMS